MKKRGGERSSRCARLDRMRMCVQPVAGGRQPTNRGKIMGRSSFVHVGGSMLSAFTFREFRVINRRAGGRFTRVRMRVCSIYACISVFRFDCTQSCSELSPMKRNRESGRRYPNIRHPRDLCTPFFGTAACSVAKRNSSRRGARKRSLLPSERAVAAHDCCF